MLHILEAVWRFDLDYTPVADAVVAAMISAVGAHLNLPSTTPVLVPAACLPPGLAVPGRRFSIPGRCIRAAI
jgi:hypothetical protein